MNSDWYLLHPTQSLVLGAAISLALHPSQSFISKISVTPFQRLSSPFFIKPLGRFLKDLYNKIETPSSQQQQLTGPFLVDKVRAAMCGLNAKRALRPDGIPVFFYKDSWARVGPDVMALMEEFHAGTCRMCCINQADITLLPKTPGAEQVGDFRPTSLSNNIYLIIAKVLANRLRGLLGTLISPL